MRRSKEMQTVLDFCLEHAESAPVRRRVSLYRGLAEFCGDEEEGRELLRQAELLEQAEYRFEEFRFRLSRKAPLRKVHRPKARGHKRRQA